MYLPNALWDFCWKWFNLVQNLMHFENFLSKSVDFVKNLKHFEFFFQSAKFFQSAFPQTSKIISINAVNVQSWRKRQQQKTMTRLCKQDKIKKKKLYISNIFLKAVVLFLQRCVHTNCMHTLKDKRLRLRLLYFKIRFWDRKELLLNTHKNFISKINNEQNQISEISLLI